LPSALRAVCTLILALGVVLAPGGQAQARPQHGARPELSLSPLRPAGAPLRDRAYVVRTVRPGQALDDVLVATNLTGRSLRVRLGAVDAQVTPEGQFAPGTRAERTGRWIGLGDGDLTLPPHGTARVAVRIRVPADAEVGDHLAAVTLEKYAPTPVGGGVAVRLRVGVRVYLAVTGGGAPAAPTFAIRRLEFTGTAEDPRLSVTIAATGPRLVEPLGTVRVARGPLGQTARLPVLGAVPARSMRTFVVPVRGPLDPGAYTADLRLRLADGTATTRAHIRFVVPGVAAAVRERSAGWSWWAGFGGGLSLLALLLLLVALLRRRRRDTEPVVVS
jgi:hypothetical protein